MSMAHSIWTEMCNKVEIETKKLYCVRWRFIGDTPKSNIYIRNYNREKRADNLFGLIVKNWIVGFLVQTSRDRDIDTA